MASVALVMSSMPVRCESCVYRRFMEVRIDKRTTTGEDFCLAFYPPRKNGRGGLPKPAWCPLKELPEPEVNNYITDEDMKSLPDNYKVSTAYMLGHQEGWNACLDTITAEKEEVEKERLTERDKYGLAHFREKGAVDKEGQDIEVVDRLASYEDAEEEKRLLELPVPVGGNVYAVLKERNGYYGAYEQTVFSYRWDDNLLYLYIGGSSFASADQIGKTVFLTKEEAEAKIRELESK